MTTIHTLIVGILIGFSVGGALGYLAGVDWAKIEEDAE